MIILEIYRIGISRVPLKFISKMMILLSLSLQKLRENKQKLFCTVPIGSFNEILLAQVKRPPDDIRISSPPFLKKVVCKP